MSADLFPKLNAPLEPIPSGLSPSLHKLPSVEAVLFDIYGTLIISGTGDISIAQTIDREAELHSILTQNGFSVPTGKPLSKRFYALIQEDHAQAKAKGITYPEVDILEIWSRFLESLKKEIDWDGLPDKETLQRLAIQFECAVNPVWPMPGLEELLAELKRKAAPLGIVSNAQFYTPLMLEGFTGRPLKDLGFQEDLSVWSYRERRGKPSVELFEKLTQALAQRNLSPDQALYVGNDMLNDVWTANEAGLRTALFAGDKRSLRLREEDERCQDLRPHVILTELRQLWQVI